MRRVTVFGLLMLFSCVRPLPEPAGVTLVAPEDKAVVRRPAVIFSWQTDAATSQFQVGTDRQLKKLLADTTVATESLELNLGADGVYYWRVRPRSAAGAWGDWSDTRMVTLERFRLAASAKTQGYPHDVWVQGNRAYVADGQAGLAVFDVTDPLGPVFLGSKMDSLNEAWGVTASDSFAYVAYGYKEL
ncbi:MAG: hypothetical protein ABIK86_05800, partial [candidate division WOR-3 bacterium]